MLFSVDKTYIMGVLNITPDSFSDGGRYSGSVDQAVAHAKQLVAERVDIIDIGGESTRPGAVIVSPEEELARVLPVVERLRNEVAVPLSIDTYKPLVAERCLKVGASMINDVTGLGSADMRAVAAHYNVPVVVMHMQGKPQTMQANPQYGDVIAEIKIFFEERIALARADGITKLILDPGIGFGKTLEHNLAILARLNEFNELGYPLLVGPSRKAFIGKLTGGLPVDQRLEGTIAAAVIASMHGARIVRVHDVGACRRALQVADAVRRAV